MRKFNTLIAIVALTLGACAQTPIQPTTPPEPTYVYVGDNWRALQTLQPPPNAIQVSVQAPEQGSLGQQVQFQVTPNDNGYLWLIQVDANDQVELLFPNQDEPENYVRAGNNVILPGRAGYYYYLDRPLGQNLLTFIITEEKNDITQVLPPRIRDALYQGQHTQQVRHGLTTRQGRDWGINRHVITVH